jgi:uncharacterized membrane protein SpoIIM required for sporulation
MLLLGLLVLLVGVVLILVGVFSTEVSPTGQIEVLGIDVGPTTLFVLGIAAGAAVLWGLSIARFGVRRSLQQRKEQKKMEELSEKLDRADAERRRDADEDRR